MNAAQRLTLLRAGNPQPGEQWADLGCGDGAFTLPLAQVLGSHGSIVAVDRDSAAIAKLRNAIAGWHGSLLPAIDLRTGDLARLPDLPPLDGVLLANALHYIARPAPVLGQVTGALRPGGRIVVIEYDRADRNPWVPHPIPISALSGLAAAAGIPPFDVIARVASDFGRTVYAAVSRKAQSR